MRALSLSLTLWYRSKKAGAGTVESISLCIYPLRIQEFLSIRGRRQVPFGRKYIETGTESQD